MLPTLYDVILYVVNYLVQMQYYHNQNTILTCILNQ